MAIYHNNAAFAIAFYFAYKARMDLQVVVFRGIAYVSICLHRQQRLKSHYSVALKEFIKKGITIIIFCRRVYRVNDGKTFLLSDNLLGEWIRQFSPLCHFIQQCYDTGPSLRRLLHDENFTAAFAVVHGARKTLHLISALEGFCAILANMRDEC